MAKEPLRDITKNQNEIPMYSFPRDLNTSAKRLHSIFFTISEPQKANISTQAGSVVNYADKLSSIGQFFSGTALKDAYNSVLEPPNKIPKAYVYLYMPDTVNVNQNLKYSDVSVTELFSTLSNTAELYERGRNTVNGDTPLSTISPYSAYIPSKISNMLNRGGTKHQNDERDALVLSKMGYASNPQLEVVFKGVGFRTFQFDFFLTPYNEDEAQSIRDIVKCFRYHSAPSLDESGIGRFFISPSMFDIELYFNSAPNQNIHKILPSCVLESVIVDYSPSGWTTYTDGMPVQTRLTLRFMEVDIITKEKVEEGY